jgi:hypothetical protein
LLTPSTIPLSVNDKHHVMFRYFKPKYFEVIKIKESSDRNLHPQKSKNYILVYGACAKAMNP